MKRWRKKVEHQQAAQQAPESSSSEQAARQEELADARAELRHLREELADLQDAARSWSVIDQAIGVIMAQNRCDAAAALAILRRASQRRNMRMTAVAELVVEQVAGRPVPPPTFTPRPENAVRL